MSSNKYKIRTNVNTIPLNKIYSSITKNIGKNNIKSESNDLTNIKSKNISSSLNSRKKNKSLSKNLTSSCITNEIFAKFSKIKNSQNNKKINNLNLNNLNTSPILSNDILKGVKNKLKDINSEKYINDTIEMFKNFQQELLYKLERNYNQNTIKTFLQNNFDKIINFQIENIHLFERKCKDVVLILNKKIKELQMEIKQNTEDSVSLHSNPIINNYTNNNNNIIIFDENKKKLLINEEEIMVNLINNLSTNIKNCNKKFKTSIINTANLIQISNNKLIQTKNQLDLLINKNSKNNLIVNNIKNDIDNLYSLNIDIIDNVKVIDNNQLKFYEDSKEIFNCLKSNHKSKLKQYYKLFKSLQNIQDTKKNQSSNNSRINSLNYYYTFNNTTSTDHSQKHKKVRSLPTDVKNDIKYLKISTKKYSVNNRTRNNSNSLYENKVNDTSETGTNNLSSFTNTNTFNNNFSFRDEDESEIKNNNIKKHEIFYLATNMMEFFNKMNILQESIINKKKGINQMKIDFEVYKKKLIKYLKSILKGEIINQNNISTITNNNHTSSYNKIVIENCNDSIPMNNKTYSNDKLKIIKINEYEIKSDVDLKSKLNSLLEKYSKQDQELNTLVNNKNELESKINALDKNNKELTTKLNNNKNAENSLINENKNLKHLLNKNIAVISHFMKNKNNDNLVINLLQNNLTLNLTNEDEKINKEEISEILKKFENYLNELNTNLKNLKESKNKYKKQAHENEIKANAYKKSLDEMINKIEVNEEKNNVNNIDNNKQNIISNNNNSVKENNNNNNKNQNNFDIIKSKFTNELSITGIKSNLGILNNINKNIRINNNPNVNLNNSEINKEIIRYQKLLIEKIKALEDVIIKNKKAVADIFNTNIYEKENTPNPFDEIIKEEQENCKIIGNLVLSFINFLNLNLSKKTDENEINKINNNNIDINSYNNIESSDSNNNNNPNMKEKNLNFDYNKKININDIYANDFNLVECSDKKNSNVNELKEENSNLTNNEILLLKKLKLIKAELEDKKKLIEETFNQNLELIEYNKKIDQVLGYVKVLIEKLINEIKINTKIKGILHSLLSLLNYSEEQIKTIFKNKEKNIDITTNL